MHSIFDRTRFITASDLMLQLATAKEQGKLENYMKRVVTSPKLGFNYRNGANTNWDF